MAGLKVLSVLDSARTQLYHFKTIIIAGMGLFTDAYDLFCIAPVLHLLGGIHYPDNGIPAAIGTAMIAASLIGTAIGQIVFGFLGDRTGRRKVYGLSLVLMVVGSLVCGLSLGTSKTCVMLSLVVFRFLLGLGIGGDYPLSATIMSEFANRRTRGAFIAAVFSMQGFGILMSCTVTMVVCTVFNSAAPPAPAPAPAPMVVCTMFNRAAAPAPLPPPPPEHPVVADLAWRVIVMIGALPAGLTYYWRMKMPETARYTALVERNVEQAAKDMQKVLSISLSQIAEEKELEEQLPPIHVTHFSNNNYSLFSKQFLHRHGRDLFACSACWFLLDIVFYSGTLFLSHIYGHSDSSNGHCGSPKPNLSPFQDGHRDSPKPNLNLNPLHDAFNVAKLQAIIAICSVIPGYYATVYFVDRFGRFKIQFMGFLLMAVMLLSAGIPNDRFWHPKNVKVVFWILCGLMFFFANFGPNTTTFMIPAELFPARLRSTCHGISGASGKIGAMIGSVGYLWASHPDNGHCKGIGTQASLVILGGVCLVGMIVTYFFTFETMGRSLEENEKDDDQNNGACFVRLIRVRCIREQSTENSSL